MQFIIHELVNAIYNQKQIRFQYHNKPYIFSPYSLVSNNQRYYLVGYNHYAQKIYHLKVEKIQELEVTNNQAAPICEVSEYDDVLDVADYMMKTYNMYSGEQTKVKLRFTSKIFDEMKNILIIRNSKRFQKIVLKRKLKHQFRMGLYLLY